MKIKRIQNKKAAFHAEVLVQFFSFIALILVIIIFASLFSIKGCQKTINQKIASSSDSLDYDYILLNYMRSSVNINGENISISDLIIESDLTNDYTELDKYTKDYFKGTSLDNIEWSLVVGNHVVEGYGAGYGVAVKELIKNLTLPSYNLDNPIFIELNEHYFFKVVVTP